VKRPGKRLSRGATEPTTLLSALSAEPDSDDRKKLLEGLSDDEKKFFNSRTTLEFLIDLRRVEDLCIFEVERTAGLDNFNDLLKAFEQHGPASADCYTSVEWDEIRRSITIREGSHWAVIRFHLLRAARWYRWRKVFWHEKHQAGTEFKDDTAAWKKIFTFLRKAQVAARDVTDLRPLLHDIELAWRLATDTKLAEQARISIDGSRDIRKQIDELFDQDANVLDQVPDLVGQIEEKKASVVLDLLSQNAEVRAKRRDFGEFGEPRAEQCYSRVPKQDVIRLLYYRDLLRIWTKYIGGDLATARDPIDGAPGGPLIQFLRAVTRPVMGEQAPSLEALRKAIRREKRLRNARPLPLQGPV
jgi:hypothetical protein